MFWGLILKANKKYTQTTKQAFHISQAALDVTSCADGPIQLFLTYENIKYLICTLRKNTAEQVMLDLNFNEGDEISLQSQGSGTIHISGYVTELNDPFDDDFDEEESETEDIQVSASKKSKKPADAKALKSAVLKKLEAAVGDDDDDDEDDSDFNGEVGDVKDDSDNDEEGEGEDEDEDDDDDDEDDDDEEEDESEDEEVQQPQAKQPKLEKPKVNGTEPQKKDKKDKKDKKEAPQQQPLKQKGGEQTLAGGVKVEDIRIGNGPEAKQNKRAQVYYEGRLKSNNKVFDSLKQGAPFKFGLGRGEVIKGWDVGVVGMKVGGKRRITCPPHMAYGARGSPPTIPPNSTLVFEVELKGVQ